MKRSFVLALAIVSLLPISIVVGAALLHATHEASDEVVTYRCNDTVIAQFDETTSIAYGSGLKSGTLPDPDSECMFHFESRLDMLDYEQESPFTSDLGQDLFCDGIKVGTATPDIIVAIGDLWMVNAKGELLYQYGCSYSITK